MEKIQTAMTEFDRNMRARHQHPVITFDQFLEKLIENPGAVIRNIFQVFHDMVTAYVGAGRLEYPDDPEAIHFIRYDCSQLFVEGSDHPFFADRLFAYRLIEHIQDLRRGAQQNKIYIFDGPPGCGKSTFLNNLLRKLEEYSKTEEESRFEAVWRLDRKLLCQLSANEPRALFDSPEGFMDSLCQPRDREDETDACADISAEAQPLDGSTFSPYLTDDYIEVPCPSHDHPILMIPKHYRRKFFDDIFLNDEFKWKLFTEKEYEWVFRDQPCTICSSIYWALLNRLESPRQVFKMLFARPYPFTRRLGEGISVFNPGDRPARRTVLGNPMLQRRINELLRDSNQVRYIFSRYAKTNNGVYALMDIKNNNIERLIELHNIISEGVHKVEDIEENVNSMFIALMNPEDKKNIQGIQSFSDRIEYIHIPYVIDLNTEVDIYRNVFGKHIDTSFLPRVLHNFARVIIATRLDTRSAELIEWIGDPEKYELYCDKNLQLLKMEIYTGNIPAWLTEEDRKTLTAKRHRKILAEAKSEGIKGLSGRDAIKTFSEFYAKYAREDKLIDMSTLCLYFTKSRQDLSESIPEGFLESLLQNYDYTVLQEVKESLYYYNREQISKDLKNYIFAVNFEIGSEETCTFTGEHLEINAAFFEGIEDRLLGSEADAQKRVAYRAEIQKMYATRTLPQEIRIEKRDIGDSDLFGMLHDRYVYNLKEKVLEPFLENENFRQAIKDYNEEAFKAHDKRIRADVTFLIDNLCTQCHYNEKGAKEVCIYVIDNDLARKYAQS